MGLLQAFWWFSPILPDLSWTIKGLIGTAVPIIALVVVRSFYISKTERRRARTKSEGSVGGWVVTAVFSVAIIWFAVGLFPIRPSLVASDSMSPYMRVGDIAIVAAVPTDTIKVGDIIDYKMPERVFIVHRVIRIEEQQGGTVFITKGDANGEPDAEPVLPDNVVGKVVFTVPKIGWVAVVLKGLLPR